MGNTSEMRVWNRALNGDAVASVSFQSRALGLSPDMSWHRAYRTAPSQETATETCASKDRPLAGEGMAGSKRSEH